MPPLHQAVLLCLAVFVSGVVPVLIYALTLKKP